MKKIDSEFLKEAVSFAEALIRNHGLKETIKILGKGLHNMSSDDEAIGCTYQILFYSLCLKHIKENYNGAY